MRFLIAGITANQVQMWRWLLRALTVFEYWGGTAGRICRIKDRSVSKMWLVGFKFFWTQPDHAFGIWSCIEGLCYFCINNAAELAHKPMYNFWCVIRLCLHRFRFRFESERRVRHPLSEWCLFVCLSVPKMLPGDFVAADWRIKLVECAK